MWVVHAAAFPLFHRVRTAPRVLKIVVAHWLYALLKSIVSFSQSINRSPNISPNDNQHLFAKAVKSKTGKFAQTAQIQVANITGRLLYFQTVTILVDSSQVWKVSLR